MEPLEITDEDYIKWPNGGGWVHKTATVHKRAFISKYSTVEEKAIVGRKVFINSYSTIYPNCIVADNTIIGSFTEIGQGTILGRNNNIGSYVDIGASSRTEFGVQIGESSHIGSGAYLYKGTILGCRVEVKDHVKLWSYITVGDGCYIGSKTEIGSSTTVGEGVYIADSCDCGYVLIHSYTRIGKETQLGLKTCPVKTSNELKQDTETTPAKDKHNPTKHTKLVIGAHNWIGDYCIIKELSLFSASVWVGDRTEIGSGAKIQHGCRISDRVWMDEQCFLGKFTNIGEHSELWGYNEIGDYTTLEGHVVFNVLAGAASYVKINAGAKLEKEVYVGSYAEIKDNSYLPAGMIIPQHYTVKAVAGELIKPTDDER